MIQSTLTFVFGFLLAGIFAFIISSFFSKLLEEPLEEAMTYSLMGAGIGASMAFIQRNILKKEIRLPSSWILAGATGLFISEFVAGFLLWILGSEREMSSSFQFLFISSMIYAIGGAITGIMQAGILGKNNLNAKTWLYANPAAWSVAFLLTLISLNDQEGGALIFFGMIILGGVLFSFLTGYAMKRILDKGQS